jgi:hypothetical protein
MTVTTHHSRISRPHTHRPLRAVSDARRGRIRALRRRLATDAAVEVRFLDHVFEYHGDTYFDPISHS